MTSKRSISLLLAMTTWLAPTVVGAQAGNLQAIVRPQRTTFASPTTRSKEAFLRLSQDYPDWNIRWNRNTGSPASLIGPARVYRGTTARQIAQNFLADNADLFGFRDFSEFDISERQAGGSTHIRFQQLYDNVPVEGAVYIVHLTADNRVFFVNGDYYADIDVQSTSARLGGSAAQTLAIADAGLDPSAVESGIGPRLVVFPFGNDFLLAWKLFLVGSSFGGWEYFISADDGSVLSRTDMTIREDAPRYGPTVPPSTRAPSLPYPTLAARTASATVFERYPTWTTPENETISVDLETLWYDHTLENQYMVVENSDWTEAYAPSGEFDYDPFTPSYGHFDEANVWYHCHRSLKSGHSRTLQNRPLQVVGEYA